MSAVDDKTLQHSNSALEVARRIGYRFGGKRLPSSEAVEDCVVALTGKQDTNEQSIRSDAASPSHREAEAVLDKFGVK